MFSSSLPIQHYLALFTSRRALLRHSGWQHSDAIWIHMKPQQIPLHLHIRTPECILLYTHSTHTHLHTQKNAHLEHFKGGGEKKWLQNPDSAHGAYSLSGLRTKRILFALKQMLGGDFIRIIFFSFSFLPQRCTPPKYAEHQHHTEAFLDDWT